MARTVAVKINGSEWRMPVSYRASKEIAERVGDPLTMAMNARNGEIQWTSEDIVRVIYIGCSQAGCSLTQDQIGEAMFDHGLQNYLGPMAEYIGALVQGGPERPVATSGKKRKPTGSG